MQSSRGAGLAGLGAAGTALDSVSPCPWNRHILPGWEPFVASAHPYIGKLYLGAVCVPPCKVVLMAHCVVTALCTLLARIFCLNKVNF